MRSPCVGCEGTDEEKPPACRENCGRLKAFKEYLGSYVSMAGGSGSDLARRIGSTRGEGHY